MYTTQIKNQEYTVYEEGDLIPFIALPPGFGIQRDLKALKINSQKAAQELEISQTQYAQLIRGELEITPRIAQHLERLGSRRAEIWLKLQKNYGEHPKHPSRGGARPNSGPKPLGHSTKQVRITAPLEDMIIITAWLKGQKNAARAVAQLIRDRATREA